MLTFITRGRLRFFLALLVVGALSSCATYYQKNFEFQQAIAQGDLKHANKVLDDVRKPEENRNRLLYYMHKGVVLQLMGEYQLSNEFFEKAYIYVEDYQKDYAAEVLALVSNPMVKQYPGEDHEKVLIHYYKAMNFLMMGDTEGARVEAKRINNKLNLMNDTYEGKPKRYFDDAFAHVILGLTYEMDKDINNAFIAYRNAYENYKGNYQPSFGTEAPLQLKRDLLRTAYLMGFSEELKFYEREFNMKYEHNPQKRPELVFFWHNGLGPVKGEFSVNFTIIKGENGIVTFNNDELGLNFAFPLPQNDEGDDGLGDLKFVRVAFPMYHQRAPFYQSGQILADSIAFPLEEAENIESIAMSVLQDRLLREMGVALLRLALKQAAEEAMREENEDVGALISVLNAATEKADTRNWQVLPYNISYARIPLKQGSNEVFLQTFRANEDKMDVQPFTYEVEGNQSIFQVYHNLESLYQANFY